MRRYQVFFLVTAILPLVVFLAVFLGTTIHKWDQRERQLLQAGVFYLQASRAGETLTPEQSAKLQAVLPGFKIRSLRLPVSREAGFLGKPGIQTERIGDKLYLTVFFSSPEGSRWFALSVPKGDFDTFSQENLTLLALVLALLLLLIVGLGIWFERDFIKPLNVLADAAGQVARGNLKDRIPLDSTLRAEARQTIEHFNLMLDKLEKHETLRSTFISTLSHDLKTPLMAQKRALELLEEEFRNADLPHLQRMVHALNTNNASQLRMVTKLLDIFRFEEGEFPLRFESVNLAAALEDCLAELHPLASQQQVVIHHDLLADLPPVEGDYSQIKRIFMNLLGNAVQNVAPGCEVWVSGICEDGWVLVDVRDNGPGISPEILPYVFDPYFTLHRTRKKINTGLGLSICRMIVEAHHGRIWVESTHGQGTRFYFRLPLTQPSPDSGKDNQPHDRNAEIIAGRRP